MNISSDFQTLARKIETADFHGGNSSNSSRYDCNPVSTAVTENCDMIQNKVD